MNSDSWFLPVLYATLANDMLKEVLQLVATSCAFACLFWVGRHNRLNQLRGWNMLVTGFLMISLSYLADVTDDIGWFGGAFAFDNTAREFILEFVLSVLGYIILLFGLLRLMPTLMRFDKVSYLANHDALTGLPNRRMLSDLFQQMQYAAQERNFYVGLMFLDIDNFKPINDKLGHDAGDKALKIVAERLRGCVRTADALGRLGGDEFVILLHKLSDKNDLNIIAKKVIESIREPIHIKHETFELSASIGGAIFPEHGKTLEELLARADEAMYNVKTHGKSNYLLANQAA
ncbi:MAG TPA: GGDEF domain-containing protein [Gammaproteobacteria bacterium]